MKNIVGEGVVVKNSLVMSLIVHDRDYFPTVLAHIKRGFPKWRHLVDNVRVIVHVVRNARIHVWNEFRRRDSEFFVNVFCLGI